jgi:hypothetical protein
MQEQAMTRIILALAAGLALSGCGAAESLTDEVQEASDELFKTKAQRQAEWEAYLDRKCGRDVACRRHEDHMKELAKLRRAVESH